MVKFTPYFYKFKSMLLDKNIPIEFRAMFLDKTMAGWWKKRHGYDMYTDDSIDLSDWKLYSYKQALSYVLRNVTIKNIASIMDIDISHPEIESSDLVVALILWGRGPAIIRKVLEVNSHIPEHDEFIRLLDFAKKLDKERKSIKETHWMFH